MKECFRRYRFLLATTILLSIVSSAAYVFIAIVLQRVTDTAVDGNLSDFREVLVGAVLYLVLIGVLGFVCTAVSKRLTRNVMGLLRGRVFDGLLRQNPQSFAACDTADYISALTNDIKLVEENYILPLIMTLQQGVLFVAALVVLFTISPLIALCLIGCLVLMLTVPMLFGKALQNRQDALSKALGCFTTKTKGFLTGYEVIKSYLLDAPIREEFNRQNNRLIHAVARSDRMLTANENISEVLAYLTLFSGFFIGAYLVIIGTITPGVLLALIQLSSSFVTPLMLIMQNAPRIQGVMPVLARLESIADYTDTDFTGTEPAAFTQHITVRDLHFGYTGSQSVLRGVSLVLEKGKKYALAGRSGCGKTTLIRLLCGDHAGYSGSILYDGRELLTLNPDTLRNLISVIHQNVYLFTDTIRHNICLYRTQTGETLHQAVAASGINSLIERLPGGLDTPVGENGAALSGGERQRIAVARALIEQKPLMVLDEGTSAIDMQTAYDIERRLLSRTDLTLVTITHNMNAELLGLYDEILYMEDGAIIQRGSLADLLASQDAFSRFFHLQIQ